MEQVGLSVVVVRNRSGRRGSHREARRAGRAGPPKWRVRPGLGQQPVETVLLFRCESAISWPGISHKIHDSYDALLESA